jgi:hypothetical protein
MTDLRKAAEMALEVLNGFGCAVEFGTEGLAKHYQPKVPQTILALRQALAQPKQESLGGEWVPCVKLPVIVHVRNQRKGETHISTREGITPVLPDDLIMRGVAGEEYPIGRELFERTYTFDTAPPKREWVGLTDEEIYAPWPLATRIEFARWVEAKLKEKNSG